MRTESMLKMPRVDLLRVHSSGQIGRRLCLSLGVVEGMYEVLKPRMWMFP